MNSEFSNLKDSPKEQQLWLWCTNKLYSHNIYWTRRHKKGYVFQARLCSVTAWHNWCLGRRPPCWAPMRRSKQKSNVSGSDCTLSKQKMRRWVSNWTSNSGNWSTVSPKLRCRYADRDRPAVWRTTTKEIGKVSFNNKTRCLTTFWCRRRRVRLCNILCKGGWTKK